MRKNMYKRQLRILLVDVILMYLSLFLALIARSGYLPSAWFLGEHLRHFSFIFVGWIVIFYTFGLYRLERPFDDLSFAQRLIGCIIVAGLASAVYFYVSPYSAIEPKTTLVLFIAIYTVLLWIWRYSYGKLRRDRRQRIGVGFIGLSPEALVMARELESRSSLGYDLRFVYDASAQKGTLRVPLLGKPEQIRPWIEETDSDLIVIANGKELPPDLTRELFGLLDLRVRFMSMPDFFELIVRKVPIGAINETWFLQNIDLKAKKPYELLKRVIDLLLASFLFLLSLPLWPFIALAIKLESRGPIFFKQERIGRFNKPFTIVKFRTMRTEGNDLSPTGEQDVRVTRLGKFLRSSRIDEIPQVLNILKGEMSFIGPRPERPEIAVTLEESIPYYRQRHLVKPGITGWDQVSGEYHSPSVEDTYKKLQYDLYYLKNMSFPLDVSIFFKTIMTVLQREGR